MIFFVFLVFFGILFTIVLYNTRYAQSIIDKQFELNKILSQAKRKAEIDNNYKMQFLANVSHELRTPLNCIIGFSEIILSDKGKSISSEKNIEYVNDIYTSGKHLLEMINDILDYSKAKAQKLSVDIIDVDLNKLGRSCLRFFELKADQAKIKLTLEESEEHIVIKADSKRLKQAILNLLSNAIKFTPEDGKVILEITKSTKLKRVFIKVIDTGIGIAPEDLTKALSSFEQVDNNKDRRFEGTGLGLPLTKTLVEIMNGTFGIESKVGEGTIVTLSFDSIDNGNNSK
jgi:two-component system cell cycle sensor histidine kinase PleC